MDRIEGLEIPENHAAFAKKIADIADTYGMDKFNMTYRPNFKERYKEGIDRRIHGEMKINYASVDGRGRPCRNLSIECDAYFSLHVDANQESSS